MILYNENIHVYPTQCMGVCVLPYNSMRIVKKYGKFVR